MNPLARLVVPALRWDRAHAFTYLEGLIEEALEVGVGGFLVEGGPRADVAALTERLHRDSAHPILVAGHAERGAAHCATDLTGLPCFGALASVAVVAGERGAPSLDADTIRRAARITARELRSIGVNWALAPVCDLDVARGWPAIGSRGASDDPAVVAAIVGEWIDACQAESVLACAMHYPGIGRAVAGSPTPQLRDQAATLRSNDLKPFAAAADVGVASVMVAPVSAPSLDAAEGAMRSARLIENLLRATTQFDGLVTTVPLDREHTIPPADEAAWAVAAVQAGCDVVLAPGDLHGTADALDRAASSGALPQQRIYEATSRIDRAAGWGRPGEVREPSLDDVMWTRQLGDRVSHWVYGARPRVGAQVEIIELRASAVRDALTGVAAVLEALHVAVTHSMAPARGLREPMIILLAPTAGHDDNVPREMIDRAREFAKAALAAGREVAVVAFCHPRAATSLGSDLSVLCCWEPTRAMQQAAARALVPGSAR